MIYICDIYVKLLGNGVYSQYFSIIVESTPYMFHVDQLSLFYNTLCETNLMRFFIFKFLADVSHKCCGQSDENISRIYSGLKARILKSVHLHHI